MRVQWMIRNPERGYIALLLSIGLLRFVNLGFLDLQAWDEALYAVRAEGILRYGGFFDQSPFSIGGLYSALHPPLYVWLTSASFAALGTTELAARFTSALFGALTLLVLYRTGKELASPQVGFVAALLFGLNPFVTFFARQGQFDTTMVFFLSLAMLWYLRMNSDRRWKSAVYAGLAVGAALMTKLFVGFGIPLAFLLWRVAHPEGRRSSWKLFGISLVAMVLVSIPWYAYMTLVRGHGDPLFFLNSSALVERTFYGVEGNIKPLEWLYFVNQLIVLFPVGVFWFVAGSFEIWRGRDKKWIFLLVWFLVFFLVFSVMRTKLAVYALPMLVPASLIAAQMLIRSREGHLTNTKMAVLIGLSGLAFLWSCSQSWRNQAKEILAEILHAEFPSWSMLQSFSPFLLFAVLVIVLSIIISRNGLIDTVRAALPFLIVLPASLMTFYSVLVHDRHQYKDGATEFAAFVQTKHPRNITVVGFDRNPQLTFYLGGADIGWRTDIEVRRISPPPDRREFKSWLSAEVGKLPDETLLVVEKDKIIHFGWVTSEEACPSNYALVFDSKRYAVFQRLANSHATTSRAEGVP